MIDVHELLQKKENDINRVRKEIHALQLVAPLLSDSDEVSPAPTREYPEATDVTPENGRPEIVDEQPAIEPESDQTSSEPIPPKRGILRDWLSRAAGE